MVKEYRSINANLEVREEKDNKQDFFIEGYFALFNDETELWTNFFETIDKGAFDNTLKNNLDIRALFDHDSSKVLGRTKSKTLELRVDDKGLYGKIAINKNDSEAVNLYHRVQRGDVDQCSFGFQIVDSVEEYRSGTNSYHTTIKDLNLYEVSIVTFPAYSNTSVTAREKQFRNRKSEKLKRWKKEMLERINKC